MQLLLGTTNQGKIVEFTEVLGGLGITLKTPLDLGIAESPMENGSTYAENALEKARFYRDRTGLPTMADDSGILVEALEKELGIHTRRWGAGKDATDAEWIAHFLKRMEAETNKRSLFHCTIAYVDLLGEEKLFEGTCDGVITPELEAEYLPGLPISACFKPNGHDKVFSALSVEEKNQISHRGRALEKFREYLRSVVS
jgi:XTP/dITP diphosphohydrolase